MLRGERIHAQMERAIKTGLVHEDIEHMRPIVNKIRSVQWDDQLVEVEHAYREDLSTTKWFGKDVWVRITQDFVARKGKSALSYDWKTGRNYGYTDQLKLYAAHAFLLWPEVERVSTAYIYIDQQEKEDRNYTRDQLPHILNEFGDRAERIQIANESNHWEAKPSRNNCRFCPVVECKDRKS
jgi:hypothetical protein